MNPIIPLAKAEQANQKADSVQEQLNQAVQEGDQLAETQQARVDEKGNPHATLKARLDAEKQETDQKVQSLTTQLAQKASKEEVANALDGSPKGTFSTLAELEVAYPNGTQGVYIVTENGHIYSWDGSAWVDRGLYQAVGIADESVTPNKTTFFEKVDKNLFDGVYYTGYLSGASPYELRTDGGKYALVEVTPNTTYTISRSDDTDRLRIGLFSDIPNAGDAPNVYRQPDSTEYTITTDAESHYMVVVPTSLAQSKEPEWLQVELGETATPYGGVYFLKKDLIPQITPISKTNFMIAGNLDADYQVVTVAPTMGSALNLQAVYDAYDDLVTLYPDYVTRTLLGNESTGLPIYRYDFTPPITGGFSEAIPKILHVSGIHGDEKQSLGSAMRFYSDLCNHWQEDGLLKVLRWNIHFIVVPAFNAWGVENNSRENSNGIDLNRNFPVNWSQSDTSGAEPLSEIESQLMMSLLEAEKNIIFAIDHHRYNPFSQDGYTMWTGTKDGVMNKHLSAWSRDMNADFKIMHPDLAVGNESRVRVQESYASTSGGWLSFSFADNGIPGTILEISADTSLNDFHTNSLGHLFGYAAKHLHNDRTKWLSDTQQ